MKKRILLLVWLLLLSAFLTACMNSSGGDASSLSVPDSDSSSEKDFSNAFGWVNVGYSEAPIFEKAFSESDFFATVTVEYAGEGGNGAFDVWTEYKATVETLHRGEKIESFSLFQPGNSRIHYSEVTPLKEGNRYLLGFIAREGGGYRYYYDGMTELQVVTYGDTDYVISFCSYDFESVGIVPVEDELFVEVMCLARGERPEDPLGYYQRFKVYRYGDLLDYMNLLSPSK